MKVKVYGARGSMPLSHPGGSVYGGNTSCLTITSGETTLILDAGSGLLLYQKELEETYPDYPENTPTQHILISHLHLDHVLGLGMFKPLFAHENTTIYTCRRREQTSIKSQVFRAFKSPNWPIDLSQVAEARCQEIFLHQAFQVGPFTITAFLGEHADTTLSFHITDGNKTVVHLLDSETEMATPEGYAELVDYCRGADLVVADAAYSGEDYDKYKGWGHSTVEHGVKLARATGCKRMLFSHLSQHYSDSEIKSWERYFDDADKYIIAKDGMELTL